MHVDHESKTLFRSKNLNEHYNHTNAVAKYPKLRAAAEPLLLEFQKSYMVETGLSHVNVILAKQRNRRTDLVVICDEISQIFNRMSIILLLLIKHIHPISVNYFTAKVC